MSDLDPAQLAQLGALLERRRQSLSAQVAAELRATGDLPVQEKESSPADTATVRLLNDLALEAAGHNAAQLRLIKRAIDKLDNGSYGACDTCGNPIGFSRLQARPEARLCIACQTRAEKR
jgi:DnaK suppressor protein